MTAWFSGAAVTMPYKSPTLWAKDADTLGKAERLQQQRDIQPQSLLLLLYTAERYSAVVSTMSSLGQYTTRKQLLTAAFCLQTTVQ